MSLYSIFAPLIYQLDAETAHKATISLLAMKPRLGSATRDARLATHVAGLALPSPVGLAAGFDKDARVPLAMLDYGFGSVEVGTVTPLPQEGNPRPRLFRLVEDRAVINRMGFNNGGQDAAFDRLIAMKGKPGIIGVNIGANKDSANRIGDYARGVAKMAPVASYITMNISSPNTPGLRALQDRAALQDLLAGARAAMPKQAVPLFLKVAPDLTAEDIDDIAAVSVGMVDALIISNTTITRPELQSRHGAESGGLSGAPLRDMAQQRIRDFRAATGGAIPLIGAGGIASASDAYARIRAGASLVQLYSALVYEGPGLANRINQGLAEFLQRDGFATVADAVGVDA